MTKLKAEQVPSIMQPGYREQPQNGVQCLPGFGSRQTIVASHFGQCFVSSSSIACTLS